MERIYFLIAVEKVRQAERLQAAEMRRRVSELKRDKHGLHVNILSRISAGLFALGRKVKAENKTQGSDVTKERVGSKANL